MAMEVVPVKLPPEVKQAMEAEASREGKSHSAFMRDALIWYMEYGYGSSYGKREERWDKD